MSSAIRKIGMPNCNIESYDIVDTALVDINIEEYQINVVLNGPILSLDLEGIKDVIHIENGYNTLSVSSKTINFTYDTIHVSQVSVVEV